MSEITAMVDGGMGPDGRRPESAQHEVNLSYNNDRSAIVARVGYSDGSDWPDRFTRFQWERAGNIIAAADRLAEAADETISSFRYAENADTLAYALAEYRRIREGREG